MKTLKKTLVTIGGILFILFGIFHLSFWKLFDWKNELPKLSPGNSNIMQMLNIGSSIILLSFGYILLANRNEVINTKIGKTILIVSALFFLARLVMEFVLPGGTLLFELILLVCVLIYLIPALIKMDK
jgi:hypothetical protein